MRKLILGCGYLGRRAAAAWQAEGHEVFAVTRNAERAEEFRQLGIAPIVADVTRRESLNDLPEADTVLYAVGYDRTAGPSKAEVYVAGLENVLHALDASAGKIGRWIYISSTSVYGQNAGETVDESSECRPTSEGGRICLEAEQVVRRHLPTANILRSAGLYGPGRLLRRTSQLRNNEPIAGNPRALLNLIHVDDAVAAVLACERRGTPGEVYLVCDGETPTRRQYYETLARLAGLSPPVFAEAGDDLNLNKRCANARVRDELQLTFQFPTAESGLRDALKGESLDSP